MQCKNCEILTGGGGQVARRRRRRGGGTWGGVFPPVNMVIANPHGEKDSLIGSPKITSWPPHPPPRQFSPCWHVILLTDDHQHFSICGHNTRRGKQRRRPVDATVGYVSSVNYPAPYPPDTNCHCLLTTPRPDAQIVFYVLDMKLAALPGESMCNYDWVDYSTGRGGRGVKTKLCTWSPHVPIYTASNHVTLAFHSDSTMEDRGFWLQFAGTRKLTIFYNQKCVRTWTLIDSRRYEVCFG